MLRLDSFFLGGFECSTHRRADGRRLDLQASTGHDHFAESDFTALRQLGILSFRDGLRWHAIETTPGVYDWEDAETVLDAARKTGADVIWDLCHYGWPDWLDVWSDKFAPTFAAFARAAAKHIIDRGLRPTFCLINEISFMAWAGGEVGHFFPAQKGRGDELKAQLCKAAILAARSIRDIAPDAVFVSAEPLINVITYAKSKKSQTAAASYSASQYEAVDILLGRRNPEYGGYEELLDVIGLNFYPGNQWQLGGQKVPFGYPNFQPLRLLLQQTYERYRKPLLIAETGVEGSCRASWLHYVCGEVRATIAAGIPVLGVCIYPILEYPGWDNDRICEVGLLSVALPSGNRTVDLEFAAELSAQQKKLAR